VECEGTIHHLIALFCTVAGKHSSASAVALGFCNGINDLAVFLQFPKHLISLQMKHLAHAMNVLREAYK
jgi:hypothetical protein